MHIKRFANFINEAQQHEEIDILSLPPAKFVKLIGFLGEHIHAVDEAKIKQFSSLTGLTVDELLSLYNAFGTTKHGDQFIKQFKHQYKDRWKTSWEHIAEKHEKKNFSRLAVWKRYVMDMLFKCKLQDPKDPYHWVAFSDDDSATKGVFNSYTNDGDATGDGWAMSH